MSRKPFIAGNWKMNMTRASSIGLAEALVEEVGRVQEADVAVAPPYVYISAVHEALGLSRVEVAAQNMYCESSGAYTGEISGAMLEDLGVRYVILGHSERRHILGETDELINRKVLKAMGETLEVILAVGELLEEREADKTTEVVSRQVRMGLHGVAASNLKRITIAYEPVWAIGTGKTATPDQAQEVHATIRLLLEELYGKHVAEATRIQYGGSVKASNAADLLRQPDIDGALVGGASLKAAEFGDIVRAGIETM